MRPRHYHSGGDVMANDLPMREEAIIRQLRDYHREANMHADLGNAAGFDETAEFARQLRAAMDEAARWSRCAVAA